MTVEGAAQTERTNGQRGSEKTDVRRVRTPEIIGVFVPDLGGGYLKNRQIW
jgi:hypothetical protein